MNISVTADGTDRRRSRRESLVWTTTTVNASEPEIYDPRHCRHVVCELAGHIVRGHPRAPRGFADYSLVAT
jgi:hypothetical protein